VERSVIRNRNTYYLNEIVSTGLITGTLFGVFFSLQVIVLNGYFGPNLETVVFSLYTIALSFIPSFLLSSAVYTLLSLFERIWLRNVRKREATFFLISSLILLFVLKTVWQWAQWGGDEAIVYSVLAALFTISLAGLIDFLYGLLSRPERTRKRNILLLIVMVVIFSASYGYYQHVWYISVDPNPIAMPNTNSERKALIIGLDSANWHVMNRLIEAERLPNIKKIMDEGVYGPMKTIQPTDSPIIWTSVITGKHHRKHGITGFELYVVPGIEKPLSVRGSVLEQVFVALRRKRIIEHAPSTIQSRKADAFWTILSRNAHSVGVVSWMGTARGLAEKVNGFMISARFKGSFEDIIPPRTVMPDSLHDEVVKFNNMPVYDSLPPFLKVLDVEAPVLQEFIYGVESIERKINLTISLAKKYGPDVIFFYDHFLDFIQHRFWRFMEPQHYEGKVPGDQVERYGKIIDYTYMYLDHAVKRLIEGTGENRDVFIVSDHGMAPIPLVLKGSSKRTLKNANLTINILSAHHYTAPPGIFIARGDGIKKNREVLNACIYDVTPTLLYLFDYPVASDMDGRILEEIFEEVYLAQHPQFFIPTYETGVYSEDKLPPLTEMDEDVLKDFEALGYIR
jgi:hypothetical protein